MLLALKAQAFWFRLNSDPQQPHPVVAIIVVPMIVRIKSLFIASTPGGIFVGRVLAGKQLYITTRDVQIQRLVLLDGDDAFFQHAALKRSYSCPAD